MSRYPKRWFIVGTFVLGAFWLAVANLAAQTQGDVNQDACAQYKHADQALNATYSTVLEDYAKDTQFIARIKQAQRAWVAFRDAHLEARFPKADKRAEYGTVYSTCRCAVLTDLTEHRTKELRTWADGIAEGDVCNGSVKTAKVEGALPTLRVSQARCGKAAGL
jgi:uncharacterized protein YecT (DUF1311 family)